MKPTSNFFSLALVLIVLIAALAFSAYIPQRSQIPTTALAAAAPVSVDPAPAVRQADDTCDSSRSVQVSGAAVINVTPDRALIQLGVQTTGLTPDAVQNANFQEIQKVISVVRGLGIEAKDIATDYYIVYPVYEDYNSLAIKGYRLDNTVSITLRDISLADDVIVAALKAGANEIQDVQFYTSELRKYRDQARELAMQAASEKAQALANAAGTEAGCVLSINENTWSQYYGSWRGGRETALWAQNVMQNTSSSQGDSTQMDDSPITLGQIAIRAEVNASYSLK